MHRAKRSAKRISMQLVSARRSEKPESREKVELLSKLMRSNSPVVVRINRKRKEASYADRVTGFTRAIGKTNYATDRRGLCCVRGATNLINSNILKERNLKRS